MIFSVASKDERNQILKLVETLPGLRPRWGPPPRWVDQFPMSITLSWSSLAKACASLEGSQTVVRGVNSHDPNGVAEPGKIIIQFEAFAFGRTHP